MNQVLVVDDKQAMRDSVEAMLSRRGHSVMTASDGRQAVQLISERPFELVISDLQMPGMDGIELLESIRGVDEQVPVVIMTAYGTVDTAVAAMKHGAYDYVTKPFRGDELLLAVDRALEHNKLARENEILRVATRNEPRFRHEIVGASSVMDRLRDALGRVAASHGTVMITGESGAGKEVGARWIHGHSPRSQCPFLALNCAALSTNLLESELFGHEKGAFTGADRTRKGRFELAHGGTLLLDEISEIDSSVQAKLLRVLQERSYERVGSSLSRRTDVRIIATSNRDLSTEVAAGRFRRDLYFRLNVLPVHMPPLRDHREDIPGLATHFLAEVAEREGQPVRRFDEAALRALAMYDWPGNVRELQNVCERAAVLTNTEIIDAVLIGPWLRNVAVTPVAGATMLGTVCDGNLTLHDIERESILATLEYHNGHRQRSARALGIGVRTLGLKLKKWKEQNLVSSSV